MWTKHLAFDRLALEVRFYPDNPVGRRYEAISKAEHEFIPGWLHFHVTTNEGAVFGLGRGQRPLFVVVSIVAIVVLTSLFAKSDGRRFYQLLLGMLLGGVLGNMYDRITLGYVRDMIYALPGWNNPLRGYFPNWQTIFPWIFNVADSLLCVGVFFMIVYSFLHRPEAKSPLAPQSAEDLASTRTPAE